jgi:hypothetical protein
MRIKILFLFFVLSLTSSTKVFAAEFSVDHYAEVIALTDDSIQLKVTKLGDDDENIFPVDTILTGSITGHLPRKHFLRDEKFKVKLNTASFPSGQTEEINYRLKIKPRIFLCYRQLGNLGWATAGGVLALTVDAVTLGLPISRGGRALWEMGYQIYDTPEGGSKIKQGAKGFVKGALFPIPELVMKGEELPLHVGSTIEIFDDKDRDHQLTARLIKHLN